jgi:ubiquinone/menaquinone biosynthesis C-methylase UbiE
MNTFDNKAEDWDKNPEHLERAKAIAFKIKKTIKISKKMTGFEYGAGTGLLSFNLIEFFKCITLTDSSTGMLEVLNEKIAAKNIKNMDAILLDLEKENIPDDKYDIIFNQMTMHHILKLDMVLDKFKNMLKSNGHLCIADLYREDGSFHGKEFSGHKGFDPEALKLKLEKTGFKFVSYSECYSIKKIVNDNEKKFPVFLITGQK